MDIQLKKRHWAIRYKYYIATGAIILAFAIYTIIISLGPKRMRVNMEGVTIAEVIDGDFLDYVDAEGIVQPILTVKVNALETGFVEKIFVEEGAMLEEGDTILALNNPELMRTIADEKEQWEREQRLYREQEIEMRQKTINLRQQALDSRYEMKNLDNKLRIAREEYQMGMKSKAEIDMAEDEYSYHKEKNRLQMQNLQHDSTATIIRRELLQRDIESAMKKQQRALDRAAALIVKAPIAGQLSYLNVTPGQQVSAGASIGEIKMLSEYKVRLTLNEYYIDRIAPGLPANIVLQNERYPLRVSRVVPEVKDRGFEVDLVFTGDKPNSLRLGKSFRIQIELGQPEQALVIPRGSFYSTSGGHWIYKLSADGSKAIKVPITIGRQNPKQYEIISGIAAGDKVITSSYDSFNGTEEIILK